MVTHKLVERGTLTKLTKYENCYICWTDPRVCVKKSTIIYHVEVRQEEKYFFCLQDVARVESKTFIVTDDKYASVPHSREGTQCVLGQWMAPDAMKTELDDRLPGCMAGRMLYVIPFR